jgi:hypothetical protein
MSNRISEATLVISCNPFLLNQARLETVGFRLGNTAVRVRCQPGHFFGKRMRSTYKVECREACNTRVFTVFVLGVAVLQDIQAQSCFT